MTIHSVVRQACRGIPAVLLAASVAACYSMARVPAGYITTQRPEQVFVRDAEGAIFAVTNPTIVKDSLVGSDVDGAVAVNLRDVEAMAVRTISKPKTYSAIATGVGILGMVTFGVVKATTAKDCPRIANRNNKCISEVSDCKYDKCEEENAVN